MKRSRSFLLVAVLLAVGMLAAAQPFFYGQPSGTDALLHFHRLAQLERAVQHGILYPRWLPDLGLGFGFPVFNYYAPLSYYLALLLRWMGLSLSTSLLLCHALGLWVLALAIYLWGRDVFGETAGVVAAFAAVYAPYTLNDVYSRGALPTTWGLAWLVLALWVTRRLIMRRTAGLMALATLFFTALLLTHNLTAMMGIPLILGYTIFLGWLHGFRPILRVVMALALALGLSAFFWAPAVLEQDYVQIWQLYLPGVFDWRVNFVSLKELLAAPRPVDPAQANFHVPISLGWIQIALVLIAWGSARAARLSRERLSHLCAITLATLGLVAMALPVSAPVWERISILRFVQFPWRFLGVGTLGIALLAGAGVASLGKRASKAIPVVVMGMMLFALPWLFPSRWPAQADPTPPEQIRFEGQTGALGTTSTGEYLPIWVQERPPDDTLLPLYEVAAPDYIIPRLDWTSLPPEVSVTKARYGLTEAELTVEASQDFRVRFLWYFFPGWHAWMDGDPQPLIAEGPYGLVAADIPAGRHHLRIAFGDTPLRQWAGRISVFSLALFAALLACVWWTERKGEKRASSVYPAAVPRGLLLACAGFAVILSLAKTVYLDCYDNPFRRTRLINGRLRGVDVPVEADFGGKLALIGYDLSTTTVRADEALDIALYWRLLAPVDTDYSIGLHLLDAEGRLYGQSDHQHPGRYPTSRLGADQYVQDVHQLMPWPGTPSGQYTLTVMVYDLKTANRLGVQDAVGNPLGITEYPVAQVRVIRPSRFPSAEALPIAQSVGIEIGKDLRLVGWGALPETVEVGHSFPLIIYWQAVHAPAADYRARLRLLSEDGTIAAEIVFAPVRNDLPTSSWVQGEILRDVRSLLVPAALPYDKNRPVPAGHYRLCIDVTDPAGAALSECADLGMVTITVPERSFGLPQVSYPLGLNLGGMATLLGYDLSALALRPGETLTVTLHWQSDAPIDFSYTVFVHLLGQDGRIYAQRDSPPVAGTRPTTGWFRREVLRDEYLLVVDPLAPPGEYRLEVGWYNQATGERVPVLNTEGTVLGDHIVLPTSVEIRP